MKMAWTEATAYPATATADKEGNVPLLYNDSNTFTSFQPDKRSTVYEPDGQGLIQECLEVLYQVEDIHEALQQAESASSAPGCGEGRDSSLDSGIHPATSSVSSTSLSDTDSEVADVFNGYVRMFMYVSPDRDNPISAFYEGEHVTNLLLIHKSSLPRCAACRSRPHDAGPPSRPPAEIDPHSPVLEPSTLPTEEDIRLRSAPTPAFSETGPETDNLVEEVYVAKDSCLQSTDGSNLLSTNGCGPNNDNNVSYVPEGKYHASVYMVPDDTIVEETRTLFGYAIEEKLDVPVLPKRNNINNNNNNNNSNGNVGAGTEHIINMKNLNSAESDNKERTLIKDASSVAYYVNQMELGLKTSVDKIIIDDGYKTESNNAPATASTAHVKVIVAIDLGTTYSGYAYRYTQHPTDKEIHIMRNWEGGDPGLNNQKTPTVLLLNPDLQFHSFGFTARDFFHDLEPQDAQKWFYFDKFKKTLHNKTDISRDTMLTAANGKTVRALVVFSHALHYLAQRAISELREQGEKLSSTLVRWVITVPAVWSHTAKQFIREAAYEADICNEDHPEQLVIALEPEAAAIWCRNLRFTMPTDHSDIIDNEKNFKDKSFMVVDCGGGTVDITVHKLQPEDGALRELHKATGEPCGSLGIDEEFDSLLGAIFGFSFMSRLQVERPAAYIELMLSFESRKRTASPDRLSTLNIFPPFAFAEFFRSMSGKEVQEAVQDFQQSSVTWSSQGMLRLSPELMIQLFQPTLDNITQQIEAVMTAPGVGKSIQQVFLVGGFAESRLLQEAVREKLNKLGHTNLIIPQGVALSVLRGAVLFGLDPGVVSIRKAQHTYGIGILKPFIYGEHPMEKLVIKNGQPWCVDIFDTLVSTNQTLRVGEAVIRRYTPASAQQKVIVLHIYCTNASYAQFVTDVGVRRVGTLRLDIPVNNKNQTPREILTRLIFSNTEVTVSALDVSNNNYVITDLTFLPT